MHHFVCMTSLGPAMLRMTKSSYKAGSKFLTAKKTSGKNFFAHPVVVRVVQEPKTLPTGKVTMYYTMQMAWQTTERVPAELQRTAYALYNHSKASIQVSCECLLDGGEVASFQGSDPSGDEEGPSRPQPRRAFVFSAGSES